MCTSTHGPITVRPARPDDVEAISAVKAAAGLPDSPTAGRGLREAIRDPDRLVLVADTGERTVGWAKTHLWPEPDGPAPAGHYLGGIAVAPQARLLGAGTLLTQVRLDWVSARAGRAYYFTNARNTASLALHARWGFAEIARGPTFRGVRFDGGAGVLLAAALGPGGPARAA